MEHSYKPVYDMIFKERNVFVDAAALILSVVMLGVMANLRIPLWPVPVTLQTFGVFLIAFFFGSRKGFLAVMSYLIIGVLGIGVFAGYNSGMGVFMGPTAGYLVGFMFMALAVGWLIEKGFGRDRKSVLYCILAGQVVLYVFGLTGLSFYLGHPGLFEVMKLGLFPFIIGDVLKGLAAVGLFPYMFKLNR